MSLKIIKIDSSAKRVGIAAAAIAAILAAFFFAKWGFAYTIGLRADLVEVAEYAVDLGPDDPQAHYTAAMQYEKTFVAEDQVKALHEFEKATALSPHNYLLWLELGKARERSGDAAGAEQALRKALQLAPNYSRVQWALGNTLLRNGKQAEAFAEIKKAVAGDASFAAAAVISAWQMLDGDVGQIKNLIGESVRLNAEFAVLLATQKRYDESVQIWTSLPEVEKKTALKTTGETLFKYLVEAKQFRAAQNVAAQNGSVFETMIANGGFETALKPQSTGIYEWRIADGQSPRIGANADQKHSGTYSLLVSFGEANKDFRDISQTVAVEAGKTYDLELFYRADLKTAGQLKWEAVDALDGKVIAATSSLDNVSDWKQIRLEFSVSQGSDGVIIRLAREGCPATGCSISGSVWFDDVSLKGR